MSSGAGEAGVAGGIDLNCDTVAVLDNDEAGGADAVEEARVSISGELLERERGETMAVAGDENKECLRGIADREDGMMGSGEGGAASQLGARSDFGVVGAVRRDAGAESRGGKLLKVEFGEKGSAEQISVSIVSFEDAVASNQTMNLGDGSGGDQKRVADVDMEGVMGTVEISSTPSVGEQNGDERLEGSSILSIEQVEVEVDFVNGGGELVDGQLELEERVPDGESITVKLIEADTGEKEITDLVTVSAVDNGKQAVSLENVSGGDQKQGIDVDVEGLVIDHQLGSGEREAEAVSHSRKFLVVEKGEEGSAELAVFSTEGFEPVEASIHTVDFLGGSGGDQKRGTDLDAELDLGEKGSTDSVAVSTVGFEAVEANSQAMYLGDGFEYDQNQATDANEEDVVRTDEDFLTVLVCSGGAEDEKLEGSSNLGEEKAEVDLVDEGVQVVDEHVSPEERETDGESLHINLLEMDTLGRESADLVAVSAEGCKAVDVSNQDLMERVTGGSKSTDLVAVSAEVIEAVEAGNLAVNFGDGFGGDQKQGIDVDADGIIIDGQVGSAESDAEVKLLIGNILAVEKGGEGCAELVSVSDEDFRPVKASILPMDFHDGSGGDQKRGTDLDEEGMVIDGELGSRKSEAEVETTRGKLLEMDWVEKGSTVLVSVSTERFEHAKVCSEAMDLSIGSGDDQRLGTDLNAESMAGVIEVSVATSVGSGGKLLEVDCSEKGSAELVAISNKVFEPVKTSSHSINLVHKSGDDQRLAVAVDAEGMVIINEDSVIVGSYGPEDERLEPSFILRKEQVDVWDDLGDGRGQAVDGELDAGKREAEFKSFSGSMCIEVDMGEKGSAKLFGASAELPEAVEASSEATNLGDGSGGDQKQGTDVDTACLVGTDGVSLTVLVVGEGDDNENMEGSSILRREQFEIQVDLVDESDRAVGTQLDSGESKAEVDSQEGMQLELHTGEKEGAGLVVASAEGSDAIEASNQAMNSGDGFVGDQNQEIDADADAEGMDIDAQLGHEERDAELKSISRKLLEVDKRSTEIFEPVETSSQATDFGDVFDGDQKRGTDVNVKGMAIDAELSSGKSVAEVEFHGEKFLEADRDDEGSTELPAMSTILTWKANSEPMNLFNGYGCDQRLKTDVDTESMGKTDEDSVSISLTCGAPKDARLEVSLISRKEDVKFQGNLVDGINEGLEGELGTTISVPEVKSYGERCTEVDMGEKGSTKLVFASTELSVAVEAGSQAMDFGSGSDSDPIQGTDVDAEGMVRNEDSVTVLVVGGALGNESLEGSLPSGKEQVEVLVPLVDGCGPAENELESHDGKLLEVKLGENRKELIAASAERFEAVEVSCQVLDLGDRFGADQMQEIDVNAEDNVDISDGSAAVSAGGEGPQDERLEDVSSVLGIEHGEALQKLVDGSGQVVDIELIHRQRTPIAESQGGMLLKAEAKGAAEPIAISAEGFEAVEACNQVMNLEHGFGDDQNQGTDVNTEYEVGTSGDSVNVSSAIGGPEDEKLERSLLLVKGHTEVLQDFVDVHNKIFDGEFGPGKRVAEVEPYSEMLLEPHVRKKGNVELASVQSGGSVAVEASSQDMDSEDRYFGEQKQESDVGAVCFLRTDEDSVVVSVDGRRPKDEMLNGSSNFVKEVEVGGESHGTESSGNDLLESVKNENAGFNSMIHAAQHQTEFDGGQRQDTDVIVETMVGGTEQLSLTVSVSGGWPEDKKLETLYEFREKYVNVGEDNIRPRTPSKNLAHPEMIGGGKVGPMKDTGHFKEPIHSKHGEGLDSKEGFGGDHRTGSCMEMDAEPLVFTVAYEGDEAQGLEAAPGLDGNQVKVKCGCDESQMLEKVAHFQNSVDPVNVDVVCDFVEGHPDEREDEIIGDNGHNQSEVNSELPAGKENMIEKGLACLPEHVEAAHYFMHHSLDDRGPGRVVYDQEMVATDKKQDNSLGSFQGSGLQLMGGEAGIVRLSTVGTERVEVFTQASSVENDPKIYNENNTVAVETVQKLDSIPIIEEQDTGLQQVDEGMNSTVVSGNIVGCFDVAKTAMPLDMPVNVEGWSSDEHATVNNMVEKGNVHVEDKCPVMNVTSAELQNGDAQLNFDCQSQKIDSSSLMGSCRGEEAHAAGTHSLGNFFMEDSNLLLGISIIESSAKLDEPSVGCQDVRPPNIPPREHEEVEPEEGIPTALHSVEETIDFSLKLQDGTQESLKESEKQIEVCDDTRAESASTSQRAIYHLCFPEEEGFYTSDLVWGKVKSHPWWPGQIFDFSGASQLAIKYQKKDHFLVAYFGDKTFAWCEESRLKPFQLFYSQMEKQTCSDSFLRALCDILEETSRRVELSMICSCLPEETYADIKYQKVENAGVRGKVVDTVFDRCEIVNYFHPGQFLEYVRALAQLPTGGVDRLELTVALAQLKAFYRSKGYTELPAFTNGSGLVENDFQTPMSKKLNDDDLDHSATLSDLFSTKGKLKSRDGTLGNQKQIVEDGRKRKSLSELMEEKTTFLLVNRIENASELQDDENCVSSGNKRKPLDYVSTDIGRSKIKKIDSQADEETKLPSPTSNSSFKVGAFISRAASKLTSCQPIRKCHGETSERGLSKTDDWSVDYMDLDDFFYAPFNHPKLQIDISVDYPPTNEMLSKLCLAARNPLKGHNFSSTVINFFCIFRNVQVSNTSIEKNNTEKPRAKRGRKKKIILDLESPDMSTPDHMKDSYWSDMIIPEKDAPLNPPKRRGRKKRKFIEESSPSSLMLNSPSDCEPKLLTGAICPHVKHMLTAERPIIIVEEKIVDERTPTAVILYFNSSNSLPSDLDLIRIFSRYGPLKEEETFIERKNNSAMVVFKKRTDAEMAFSGTGNFSTFGPALLSYRLRHFPSKSSPINTSIGEDDATLIKDGHLRNLAEPEFNGALDGNLCEAVSKESSIFVQSQGNFGTVSDMPPVQEYADNTDAEIGGAEQFSELAQYQVGDVVVSDSGLTYTGRKEPFQDVPPPMETDAASDHLLLESLDQEFSYFDLDQAEAGDISGTEVGGEKSSGLLLETSEVHPANDRSLHGESCDPTTDGEIPKQVAGTGTSDSVAEQLENGTVLETAIQLEAVDIPDKFNIALDQPGEKECSDSPAAPLVGAGTSDQSSVTIDTQFMEADSCAVEVREATTVSDSAQIELEGQDPSGSVTNAEAPGMPTNVTEV